MYRQGQSGDVTSIQILRIREGQIALFRDFANPRILEDVIAEPRLDNTQGEPMVARVITAQTEPEGFDNVVDLVRQQLPGARQQPGLKGFYLLTDTRTGKIMNISLWESREQMPADIRDETDPASWLTPPHLETFEVTVYA
jgi:quinol monooxygenase YgiN